MITPVPPLKNEINQVNHRLFEFFISPEDMLYDNDQAIVTHLQAELEELKMLIDEFDF